MDLEDPIDEVMHAVLGEEEPLERRPRIDARPSSGTRHILRRSPPLYRVAHTALQLEDVILEPGERRTVSQMPQRPFKGEWLFTYDGDLALWIHDIKVGNECVRPDARPVPASFWNITMYEATLRGLGLATSAEVIKQIEQHPLFQRLRIDFPPCMVGNLVQIVVENRGTTRRGFVATIAGKMLYHDFPTPEHAAFAGGDTPPRPEAPGNTRTAPEEAGNTRTADEPPVIPPKAPETVNASGAKELATPCRDCGVGVDQPCYGLPRGQVHRRRLVP